MPTTEEQPAGPTDSRPQIPPVTSQDGDGTEVDFSNRPTRAIWIGRSSSGGNSPRRTIRKLPRNYVLVLGSRKPIRFNLVPSEELHDTDILQLQSDDTGSSLRVNRPGAVLHSQTLHDTDILQLSYDGEHLVLQAKQRGKVVYTQTLHDTDILQLQLHDTDILQLHDTDILQLQLHDTDILQLHDTDILQLRRRRSFKDAIRIVNNSLFLQFQ